MVNSNWKENTTRQWMIDRVFFSIRRELTGASDGSMKGQRTEYSPMVIAMHRSSNSKWQTNLTLCVSLQVLPLSQTTHGGQAHVLHQSNSALLLIDHTQWVAAEEHRTAHVTRQSKRVGSDTRANLSILVISLTSRCERQGFAHIFEL